LSYNGFLELYLHALVSFTNCECEVPQPVLFAAASHVSLWRAYC
jgi:hypothetical protein